MHADLILSIAPIALLFYLMTRRKALPSYVALAIVAFLLYMIRLTWFHTPPLLLLATVINGLLTAWTPILIVWGAIFMFNTLENSGGMGVIRRWLNGITANRTAQLMIIGWSFSFFIEGVSGFGTPAAIAAPVLVGLGFPPVRVALLCLIMNSVPIAFGAVGTPLWFGIGDTLHLLPAEVRAIGFKSALIHGAAALVIPPIALAFVLPLREIRRNAVFIYLCVLTSVIPFIVMAKFDYEFPSVVGGAVGLGVAVFFARQHIGLAVDDGNGREASSVTLGQLARAALPIWGTVLILLLTRIEQIGIKAILFNAAPFRTVSLGAWGELHVTPGLVVGWHRILGVESTWTHKLLYVPSIIPFFVVSGIAFVVLGMGRAAVRRTWSDSLHRLRKPILALSGALTFVALLMVGGERSCAMTIGHSLAGLVGAQWPLFAAYLGAVGAFIGGSNTVANLTFAGIQDSVAQGLHLNRDTILALQHVGGAMGLMLSIGHIIAVCAVLGIVGQEGFIIRRTVLPVILYGIVAGLIALLM